MSEAEILNEIRNDLNFLKEKVISMEITINEIDSDIHKEFNPDYKHLKYEDMEKAIIWDMVLWVEKILFIKSKGTRMTRFRRILTDSWASV